MEIPYELMAIFSSIGVLNSLFISLFLWLRKRGNKTSNRFFALLLLAISLRIAKSVFYYILNTDTEYFIITLGHAGMVCIGPLLFLYFRSLLQKNFQFKWIHLMHFLPFLLVLSLNTWLAKNTSSYEVRHTLMMFQFLIYIVVSLELLIKSFFTIEVDHRKTYIPNYFWLGSILLAVFLIWLTFLLHNLFNLFDNIVGPVLYSFIVYIMLYLAFTKRGFEIMEAHKKKKPVLSQEESKEIFKILLTEFTDRKVFTDTELTVTKLAKCIYTQPYKLSKAINEQSGRNFSDFINYYRVEEAKRMLKHKKFINYKITAIAYDCGFNSFSAFSAAFKKFTGLTPSRYK